MVKGLEVFRGHFRRFADRYVLIGGTACDLAMDAAGLPFRATKDLDIVLCLETLDREFAAAFWRFVRAGGYRQKEKAAGGRQAYRFQKPADEAFPYMLELFSRQPDLLDLPSGSRLTPLPMGDALLSLSAILMEDDYYSLIQADRRDADGLSYLAPEGLLLLKARAWLDLAARKEAGEGVDSAAVKKHRNDVLRLYQVIDPAFAGDTPDKVKDDLREFVKLIRREVIDLKPLGLGATNLESVVSELSRIYRLS